MSSDRNGGASRLSHFLTSSDPDATLLDDFVAMITDAKARHGSSEYASALSAFADRRPVRILVIGYIGVGNTGSDLRAIETIRQLQKMCPEVGLKISIFALGTLFDHAVLQSTRCYRASSAYLPDALSEAIDEHDVVMNVEGSTYTSRFSDALAALLIGGLGLAAARGKIACAYGVDSGMMSSRLARFALATSHGTLVFARSAGAFQQLTALGIDVRRGADSAWGYRACSRFEELGGTSEPVDKRLGYAVLCPINPFWWPVRTDVKRAAQLDAARRDSPLRYGGMFFHTWDGQRAESFGQYRDNFAAVARGLAKRGFVPVLAAMERLDLPACEAIAETLPFPIRIVARGSASLDDIVRTIEGAACVVTSRYHGSVLAMANRVPVVGVSIDERIAQLFDEYGLGHWWYSCEMPSFAQAVLDRLDDVMAVGGDAVRAQQAHAVADQQARLSGMALMVRRIILGETTAACSSQI